MVSTMNKVFTKYSCMILRLYLHLLFLTMICEQETNLQLNSKYVSVFFGSKICQNENDFYE